MNIKEYISSGIIESYVLGLADAAERTEFEHMVAEHPEVKQAMEEFESSLESFMQHNVVNPPPQIKGRFLSSIAMAGGPATSSDFSGGGSTPPPVLTGADEPSGQQEGRSKVIKIKRDFSRLLAAAAVVLLLISTGLNFYFFSRYKEFNDKYQALIISQTELAFHNQILQTRLLEYEKAVEMMKDPNMFIVKMPSVPNGPDPSSATTVYWDTRTKDVYLAVNKLPTPSPDQQYQLWAMVDGKPVDAGVFDLKEGTGFTKMKNIPKAEAFAITLEKKGGSATPSLDKLYVMGKV